MTNYEKICAIITAGHIAQVEYEDGFFQLYSSITSEKNIRISISSEDLYRCYESLGSSATYCNAINDSEIKSISVYKKPLWYPKEGELVTILDTIKDEPDREDHSDEYKEMIGGPFEVSFTNGDSCAVYHSNKISFDYIDYRHLVPYFGEETKTDTLSKGKEITVTIDGKEYKAIIQ